MNDRLLGVELDHRIDGADNLHRKEIHLLSQIRVGSVDVKRPFLVGHLERDHEGDVEGLQKVLRSHFDGSLAITDG
jgi:hypothetical protein